MIRMGARRSRAVVVTAAALLMLLLVPGITGSLALAQGAAHTGHRQEGVCSNEWTYED